MSDRATDEQFEDWVPMDRTDSIYGAPSHPLPARVMPYSVELPTHELHPEDFEKLVRAIAVELDGARLAYRYGVRGQDQEGLDVIAFMEDKSTSAYQVKRMQVFTKADLDSIVELYRDGQRPFSPKRFVIAVACLVEHRKILDALDRWQHAVDFDLELWDRAVLSDRVRPHRGLVARFFGEQTAGLICGGEQPVDDRPPAAHLADAAIRGPIRQLRLDTYLRSAEADSAIDPHEAAAKYSVLAQRLEAMPLSVV